MVPVDDSSNAGPMKRSLIRTPRLPWFRGRDVDSAVRRIAERHHRPETVAGDAHVLHMASPSHHANLMIRYMVAIRLAELVPTLRVSAVDLPYWGIRLPEIEKRATEKICAIASDQHFPHERIRCLCDNNIFSRFEWRGYGQRLENFPQRSICQQLFISKTAKGLLFEDDVIVCPVRASEILGGIHPGYPIIPVEFYQEIFEGTKLKPVFIGQTSDDNVYMSELRRRFPDARFLPHTSAIEDFQTIRNAKHIVLPISTFAWLAAWLSEARTIYMPIYGIYNPVLFPTNLLPIGESRYRFFQFPAQPAVPLHDLLTTHEQLSGQWNEIDGLNYAPAVL